MLEQGVFNGKSPPKKVTHSLTKENSSTEVYSQGLVSSPTLARRLCPWAIPGYEYLFGTVPPHTGSGFFPNCKNQFEMPEFSMLRPPPSCAAQLPLHQS